MVATPRHPILQAAPLTLEAIARYPLITYDDAFTGRGQINKAFLGRGLKPSVVLTAIDPDVIKKRMSRWTGIGILARMAYDPAEDRRLGMVDAAHLFESSTTRIGLRRRAWLRAMVRLHRGLRAASVAAHGRDCARRRRHRDPGL